MNPRTLQSYRTEQLRAESKDALLLVDKAQRIPEIGLNLNLLPRGDGRAVEIVLISGLTGRWS